MKKTELWFMSLLIVAIALLCQSSGSLLAMQSGLSPQAGQEELTPEQQRNLESAKKSLLTALSEMLPGGIAPGSPRESAFKNAIEIFRTGKVKETLAAFDEMAKTDADLPPSQLIMAGLSFAVGDRQSGVGILEKCALQHAGHPSVYLSFGQLALNDGRVTDAAVQAEKAAAVIDGGKFSPAQLKFFKAKQIELGANVFLRRRQYDASRAALARLQSIEADRPAYFLALAELDFKEKDDYEGALASLERFAETAEQPKKPILTLVEWMQQSGKTDLAVNWMDRAVRENPTNKEIQLSAARFAMAREAFPDALISVRNFEKEAGETFATKDIKGRIAFAQQNYGVAEAHFQVLNERAPQDINYANVYALCLIESNDKEKQEKAKIISQKVVQAIPENTLAVSALGYIHLRLGQLDEAKMLLGRAARSNKVTPEISYFIASLLHQTGQSKQAGAVIEQSLKAKSLFLYRSAARELANKIKASSGGLPAPGQR